jgi:cytochrome P450
VNDSSAPKRPLPSADGQVGLKILRRLAAEGSPLPALEMMHAHVGNLFQINAPNFRPAVMVGPELNRRLLVTERENYLWRTENDPVTKLLRTGVLVVDGPTHDWVRSAMEPALTRKPTLAHIAAMIRCTDQVIDGWAEGDAHDMLVEMRKVALLILIGTLFGTDFAPDLERMWGPILKSIDYISPGLWVVLPQAPRFGFEQALGELDDYLYGLIDARRQLSDPPDDLLTRLVQTPGLSGGMIRDQLLTMLIAGHDTSTALFAWLLHLLGEHPDAMQRTVAEVDAALAGQPPAAHHLQQLEYLDMVIRETLRLYPPIHIGNRRTGCPVHVGEHTIEAGQRVMYSIYLSHRDPAHWEAPNEFRPERFAAGAPAAPAFAYLPFGGGPRNCIGATFAQIEAKVVLARLLQRVTLTPVAGQNVHAHMGATLEPRPGVKMVIRRRL